MFKSEETFKLEAEVKITRNSERRSNCANIGRIGKVIGYKSNDCIVEFQDGTVQYIIYKDLEIIN